MTDEEMNAIEAQCVHNDGETYMESCHDMTGACRALMTEVRRLRGLVQEAEWGSHETSCSGCEGGYDESYDCCPWCGECGKHKSDCLAFSGNGVLR